MYLRRSIFHDCKGTPRLQKAVAFAIHLKPLLGRNSTLHNYTINRLKTLTGVSAPTIKRMMPVLIRYGLVHFTGKNNQHLVVSKLASKHEHSNINIDAFNFGTHKEIYKSLRAFIALAVQARKDFIRRTFHSYRNPANNEEFKAARKKLRRLVDREVIRSLDEDYKDLGTSLQCLAQETGNCRRTVQRIIDYAVENVWCKRQYHLERHYLKGICYREDGKFFTYSTEDYIVIIYANSYLLRKDISLTLGGGLSWVKN